jgi:alpha-tubulin suppressor-like RCC1 family protein
MAVLLLGILTFLSNHSMGYAYGPTGQVSAVGAMATSDTHGLLLRTDGRVYAWGSNMDGELGQGLIDLAAHPDLELVSGLPFDIVAIAASGSSGSAKRSYAVTSRGELYEWGAGIASPTMKSGLPAVRSIAAGDKHALAIDYHGEVWAWGDNTYGQIGNGEKWTVVSSPVKLTSPGSNVVMAAAGAKHSVVLKEDGTVWAWGDNSYGQLGDGTTILRTRPVPIHQTTDSFTPLPAIKKIAAGNHHTLAVALNSTVYSWGDNRNGQIAYSSMPAMFSLPQPFIANAVDVSAGGDQTLVIDRSSGGTFGFPSVSGDVPNGASSVLTGGSHHFALYADGRIKAWGSNSMGQLALGDTASRTTAADVWLNDSVQTSVSYATAASDQTRNIPGRATNLTIQFQPTKALAAGDSLSLKVPSDFGGFDSLSASNLSVFSNGSENAVSSHYWDGGSSTLHVSLPVGRDAGVTDVSLQIRGITNPESSGSYRFFFSTLADALPIAADYTVHEALSLTPGTGGSFVAAQGSPLYFSFYNDEPIPGGGIIDVTFPSGFTFPNKLGDNSLPNGTYEVRVNGILPYAYNGATVSGQMISIGFSDYVAPGSLITLALIPDTSKTPVVRFPATPGSYEVSVQPSGGSQAVKATLVTLPAVTSADADTSYGSGQSIDLKLNYPKPVQVSGGTPTLLLHNGGTASYLLGSGSSSLVFRYTVQPSDTATMDLNYSNTTSLSLNGASITYIDDGTSAELQLPAIGSGGDLAAMKQLVVDTVSPSGALGFLHGVNVSPSRTFQLTTNLVDDESGIKQVRYSLDAGTTWTDWKDPGVFETLQSDTYGRMQTVTAQIMDYAGNTEIIDKQIDINSIMAGLGRAVQLGDGKYIEIPKEAGADFSGPGVFTVEMWVKTGSDSASGTQTLLRKNAYYGEMQFWMYLQNNRLKVGIDKQSFGWFFSGISPKLEENEWNHIAVVKNGPTLKYYVNGVYAGSETFSLQADANVSTNHSIWVGSDWEGNHYPGQVDELRIWSSELSHETLVAWQGTPVTATHPQHSALRAYYRMDESSGTVLADEKNMYPAHMRGTLSEADRLYTYQVETNEDSPFTGAAYAFDLDGQPMSYEIVSQGNLGHAELQADGQYTYTPDANENGMDSFTYKVKTAYTESNLVTVPVKVAAVNDAPSFLSGGDVSSLAGKSFSQAGWAQSIHAGGLSDEASQPLSFVVESLSGTSWFSVQPSIDATGTLTYTGAAGYIGSATLSVRLFDGELYSDPVTFNVSLLPSGENMLTGLEALDGTLEEVDTDSYDLTILQDAATELHATLPAYSSATVTGAESQITGSSLTVTVDAATTYVSIEVRAQNGDIKVYHIYVKRLSTNTKLSLLMVNGEYLTGDGPFALSVPYSMDRISVLAYEEDPIHADVVISPNADSDGMYPLAVGLNTVSVTVTSESGLKATYTIEITRQAASTNAALKELKVDDTSILAAGVTSYTYPVPYTTSYVTVFGDVYDLHARVAMGSGAHGHQVTETVYLNEGSNSVTLEVTSEAGTVTTYHINILRASASANTDLQTLNVGDEFIYEAGRTDYAVTVPKTQSSIALHVTAADALSVVRIGTGDSGHSVTEDVYLSYGDNPVVITVISQSGSTREYKLVITRTPLSVDNQLSSLSAAHGALVATMTDQYRWDLVDTIPASQLWAALLGHSTVTVTGAVYQVTGDTLTVTLDASTTAVHIEVAAENGAVRSYLINVNRLSTGLQLLEVNGYNVYQSGESVFSRTVPYQINSASVRALVTDMAHATVKIGSGTPGVDLTQTIALNEGLNTIPVVVTSLSGVTRSYTLQITREPASVNTNLESLAVDGAEIYQAGTTEYTRFVPYHQSYVQISVRTSDDLSKASVQGGLPAQSVTQSVYLPVGVNTVLVQVTSESGASQQYRLIITRAGNTTLQSLRVDQQELLQAGETSFTKAVPFTTERIWLDGVPSDAAARISVNGGTPVSTVSESVYLQVGVNPITLTVTSGTEAPRTYTLLVTRQAQVISSGDTGLYGLTVNGTPVVSVTGSTYSVTVTHSTTSATVTAAVYSLSKAYIGSGSLEAGTTVVISLNEGINIIPIAIVAENGSSQVYSLIITRRSAEAQLQTELDIPANGVSDGIHVDDLLQWMGTPALLRDLTGDGIFDARDVRSILQKVQPKVVSIPVN